jgi:hypothetical protein
MGTVSVCQMKSYGNGDSYATESAHSTLICILKMVKEINFILGIFITIKNIKIKLGASDSCL